MTEIRLTQEQAHEAVTQYIANNCIEFGIKTPWGIPPEMSVQYMVTLSTEGPPETVVVVNVEE